jgi:hypothetical protein
MDQLGLPRSNVLAFTLPGFATSDATKSNAWLLMRSLGVTAQEIDIRPAARQLLADIGHPFARDEPVYDVTFENVQAGLRTDYPFAWRTTTADWFVEPAIYPNSRSVGAPMASAITCRTLCQRIGIKDVDSAFDPICGCFG